MNEDGLKTEITENEVNSQEVEVNADQQDIEAEVCETTVEECVENDECCNEEQISMKQIIHLLEETNKKYDQKIASDEHKNTLFNKMYQELDMYKKDIQAKLLKPYIMEIIMLIEDTVRFVDKIGEMEPDKVASYVEGFPADLINILNICDVELYEDDSEMYNPSSQKVVKRIETDNVELDNKIESRIRKGYRWNGMIMRYEMVNIYKCNK